MAGGPLNYDQRDDRARKWRRFIVFHSEQYYPSGGLTDAAAEFDELGEALRWVGENWGFLTYGCELRIFDRIDGITAWDRRDDRKGSPRT